MRGASGLFFLSVNRIWCVVIAEVYPRPLPRGGVDCVSERAVGFRVCMGRGLALCAGVGRIEREKGVRWMPWRQKAMKDVARCDKPRGDASDR